MGIEAVLGKPSRSVFDALSGDNKQIDMISEQYEASRREQEALSKYGA